MRWGQLNWVPGQITMNLYHFDNGPAILVKCRQFIPDSPEQCQVWGRTPGGWRLEPTAAFGLDSAVSEEYVAQYISECVPYCAEEAARNSPQLRTIIQNASRQDKLLPLALQLWTANRLLMRGWQAKEDPALGICRVTDPESPYYNTTIAPRVLQNQIDSRVEAFMARVELQLLKDLQKAMKQKTCSWIEIFSTVFLILRVAEKDIWRLMYWLRHENEVSDTVCAMGNELTKKPVGIQMEAPRVGQQARPEEHILLQPPPDILAQCGLRTYRVHKVQHTLYVF